MVQYDDVFNVYAMFILFRETLEAGLIVSILLAILQKLNRPDLKKYVWYGVIAALTISIIIAVAFIICFYAFENEVFEGKSEEIFEGVVYWLSAIIITILAFAMLRFMGWEAKWQRRLEALSNKTLEIKNSGGTAEELAALEEQHAVEKAAQDRRDAWKCFITIFIVVIREGIEAIVFIAGVGHAKPSSIPLPAFVGIVLGVIAGMVLYYSGKLVKDIKWVFITMTILLLLMAAGAVVNGMAELAEAGCLGNPSESEEEEEEEEAEEEAEEAEEAEEEGDEEEAEEDEDEEEEEEEEEEQPWYLKPLWDTSGCCGQDADENKFFALLHSIFGYQDTGTALGIILYVSYWLVVLAFGYYRYRQGSLFDADFKHTAAMKKQQQQNELAGDGASGSSNDGIMPLSELKGVLAEKEAQHAKEGAYDTEMGLSSPPAASQPSAIDRAPSAQVLLETRAS